MNRDVVETAGLTGLLCDETNIVVQTTRRLRCLLCSALMLVIVCDVRGHRPLIRRSDLLEATAAEHHRLPAFLLLPLDPVSPLRSNCEPTRTRSCWEPRQTDLVLGDCRTSAVD